MDNEPDLAFDIDALFEHLVNELDHDFEDEMEWDFTFQSEDFAKLGKLAEKFEADFEVSLHHDEPDAEPTDDPAAIAEITASPGNSLLSVRRVAALTASEVKELAAKMATVAETEGVTYLGVSCYDPFDEDEMFGWLELEDAVWRLRHFADAGLAENEDLPWAFMIISTAADVLRNTEKAILASGFDRIRAFDEPDEEGTLGICVFVDGSNNEAELTATYERLEAIITPLDAELLGVQFFPEEAFDEDDEADEGL
jgi:hypothetical protein